MPETQEWDVDPKIGCHNSSERFKELVGVVVGLIRGDSYALLTGNTEQTALLIMGQLVHKYGLAPQPREHDRKETELGEFLQDASGLWHYCCGELAETAAKAMDDALEHRPTGPSWFWFNGRPAPMFLEDNRSSLYHRWMEWRAAYQADVGERFLREISSLISVH